MSYILPTFLVPGAGTVTPAMLAPQTPGSVLLYDASGNAIAYAPVAAGRVLTDNGPGLPPTWQALSNRFVTIDPGTNLVAATGYTSPTWVAETYEEIIVYFNGKFSAFSYLGFRANNDSTLKYVDNGVNNNMGLSDDHSVNATLGFARCGVDTTGNIKLHDEIHFYPLTDGLARAGSSWGKAIVTGATTGFSRLCSFGWTDTATAVTFITLLPSTAATMTGRVRVYGVKAQ